MEKDHDPFSLEYNGLPQWFIRLVSRYQILLLFTISAAALVAQTAIRHPATVRHAYLLVAMHHPLIGIVSGIWYPISGISPLILIPPLPHRLLRQPRCPAQHRLKTNPARQAVPRAHHIIIRPHIMQRLQAVILHIGMKHLHIMLVTHIRHRIRFRPQMLANRHLRMIRIFYKRHDKIS